MGITKKFLKSKPVCKVTFKVPKTVANGAKDITIVGDFNDWNSEALPMKGLKNGSFTATVDLPSGKEYQFRYLLDGDKWENDEAADKYVPSPFGGAENCVLVV
ncbi:isoamylase early set domain-containing protein [Pontibacter sp. G13]|uniref:isoamylase early set domain-containing protein n=1 Tax=Pontibacter sp. G13 TaxID=3074898 RepID=UPI00288C0226|nr:isoamylase early set domain-containing protein [Pontibacter sp. G13]WNJ16860.1 isoamylase early set domain-containing protein [Pontibacter sp. G13]